MRDIIITSLCKSFGEKAVLSGLTAVIPAGRTTAVMGPSGGGKTTLANLLLSLLPPDSGEISGLPDRRAAVFQEDRLFEGFSALSNLRAVAGRGRDAELRECLAALGLEGDTAKPVSQLSGGMRRRVAIARALVADAELTVMDEPFKGLDGATRLSVMQYVKTRLEGRTLLLITHDPSEAEFFGAGVINL